VHAPQLLTTQVPLPVHARLSVSINPLVPSPSKQAAPLHRGAGLSHARLLVWLQDAQGVQLVQEPHTPGTSSAGPKHCSAAMPSTLFDIMFNARFTPLVKIPWGFAARMTTVNTPATKIRYSITF
jgi:hypothetical protein